MSEYCRIKRKTLRRLADNARRLGNCGDELSAEDMIAVFEKIDEKKILGENQGYFNLGRAKNNFDMELLNFVTSASAN